MPTSFQTEPLAEFLQEALPLLKRHWQEVGTCPESHALNFHRPLYEAIAAVGSLHISTARDTASGALQGYAVYLVQDYPHVQGLRMAQSDALYLAPECRRGFTGLQLLQAAEQALAAAGVKNIMQSSTVKRDLGPVFRRMGYALCEHVYRKEL